MIDAIIGFSVRNKLIIGALMLALVAWGGYSLYRLPIDALPDVTNNQVQVITNSPNLAPLEVERYLTAPIEYQLANLPGLVESRSISRFGLSLITLVFEEQVDVYQARTQVLERLRLVQDAIPPQFGTPQLGPLSTGLSEVYQYILRKENAADTSLNNMQLRTLQDWVVRLNLLSTPGVADVSSFGGFIKEYQAKINPEQLRAAGLTLADVYAALQTGNANTGATYIEKSGRAYFIRGLGLATSLQDVGNIVVSTRGGAPILVKDVAEVAFGSAVRYGAMTADGKGETVGGIVLMRKGENGSEVIRRVKHQMERIQQLLPPGVIIQPFIDRSGLVQRTVHTVARNLVEGGLIVILVLVLLLGNLRAGLIVASVIPLAMLFAFGMMHTVGLSGNLMSLGAIDFGLIVDGAVIMVENVVRHISQQVKNRATEGKPTLLPRTQMDETVLKASEEIRKSAAFGEVIILIVYLPLLTLTGVEGKMFQPMALTVSFAIVGALLLSLTYVPMMSALALSRRTEEKETSWAARLMHWLHGRYTPLLNAALRRRWLVIATALGCLALAGAVFWNFGGEFIPKLDEGDYAVETRIPLGASLEKTIEVSTRIQQTLLQRLPNEIETVVAKIGTSEIPTDPMSIESFDLIIALKPEASWQAVHSKAQLTDSLAALFKLFAGVSTSIQQPIEMRFNELIAGAKSDVVILIYGPDLQILAAKAQQVANVLKGIPGAEDVVVQRLEGLPQVQINYNRQRLASYGVTVQQVNEVLQMALAGRKAGVVFENDRRFDLSLRFQERFRADPEQIGRLSLTAANGMAVPLAELAELKLMDGPSEISRLNSQRRVSVGFNVRGVDVQTLVQQAQAQLTTQVNMPPGYRISYGGQFENLQRARNRLALVLPGALVAIFVLLYLTFRSLRETLLILTCIPLAAIGGVLALQLRGMPFSISAGVGFIALAGVAVLNGIVLISYLNQLEREGYTDVLQRIRQGVQVRFRPVIMTATVASLGFLPMALSTGAGAEVQKPLATVVIGGLITATLLTLVVLPVLYTLIVKNTHLEAIQPGNEEGGVHEG